MILVRTDHPYLGVEHHIPGTANNTNDISALIPGLVVFIFQVMLCLMK
jgi:hypothetical protein